MLQHNEVRLLSHRVKHFVAMLPDSRQRDIDAWRPDLDGELDSLFRLHDEEASELVLVRHAEPNTSANVRAEFGTDAPLSKEGVRQAASLGKRLSSGWVESIYTAPEFCATQTAEIIASAVERPVSTSNDLRDIDYSGIARERETCGSPSMAARFLNQPRWDALPGFEATRQFRRRAIQTLESMLAQHPARRVVVVTHTSVINAYLSMLLDIPRDLFFLPEHASVSVVRSVGDIYAVRSLNDVAHLSTRPAICH